MKGQFDIKRGGSSIKSEWEPPFTHLIVTIAITVFIIIIIFTIVHGQNQLCINEKEELWPDYSTPTPTPPLLKPRKEIKITTSE